MGPVPPASWTDAGNGPEGHGYSFPICSNLSSNGAWPVRILRRAVARSNHSARSISGMVTRLPDRGGHSISQRLLRTSAGSRSSSTAQAWTILPPACRTIPRGTGLPRGRCPVSSSNSRSAAASRSSPAAGTPLGIDQTPSSLRAQTGPPGCASRTSRRPWRCQWSKIPALTRIVVLLARNAVPS